MSAAERKRTQERLRNWKKDAVDFSRVRRGKELGRGTFGTVFIAEYNGEEFALKVQKILPSWVRCSLLYPIWRELYCYQCIEELPERELRHFNRLEGFRIVRKCSFVQQRGFMRGDPSIIALDRSPMCIEYLLHLIRGESLESYAASAKDNRQVGSVCRQICTIHDILRRKQLRHGDLFSRNIMVEPCSASDTIMFGGKEYPSGGILLKAIDMGSCKLSDSPIDPDKMLGSVVETLLRMVTSFDIYSDGSAELLKTHADIFDAYTREFSKIFNVPLEEAGKDWFIQEKCLFQFCVDHPRFAAKKLPTNNRRFIMRKADARHILRARTFEDLLFVVSNM
jgi:serine/threonine protein kinase